MDLLGLIARTGEAAAKARRRSARRRWRAARARREQTHSVPVSISVIIPAHNEQAYLKRTLMALRRQRYPCEIIVVANGCTDNTAEVARRHCDRLVMVSHKGLSMSRNLGARMAKGELLIFLDADTILRRNALRTIAERFTRDCAAGTVRGQPDRKKFAYRLIYFLKNFTHRFHIHGGSAGVIICWKDHFIRTGGFNESLEVSENSDLIKRLGRFGRYRYIGDTCATTSMRRYERRGVWRMAWLWTRLWFESWFRDLRHRTYETVR